MTDLQKNIVIGGVGSAVIGPVAWFLVARGINKANAKKAERVRQVDGSKVKGEVINE